MLNENQPLVLVQFEEHPFSRSRNGSSSDHVILLTAGFSMADYCQALFTKILHIGLSDLPDFLEYQCKQVREPERWLNTLEKLVKDNARSFNNEDLHHRRSKLISEFGFQRNDIKNTLVEKRSKDLHSMLSGFSAGKEYNFPEVHAYCSSLKTFEEKIIYLHGQIYDYNQDQTKFINPVPKPFDALCLSEIERLSKIEEIRHKEALKRNLENGNSKPVVKKKINGKLNYFIDILYRLMHDVLIDGKPFLESSDRLIAEEISSNYVDRNGKDISVKYVLTILEKNRSDKRPKRDKRFDLGEI